MRANNAAKIIAGILAVSLIAGCNSLPSNPTAAQTSGAELPKNTVSENNVPTESERAEPSETTAVLGNRKAVLFGVFESFEKAGEKLRTELWDFGVAEADVFVNEIDDCYILYASEFVKDGEPPSEGGLIDTYVIDGDERRLVERTLYPRTQRVMISDDAEKIKAIKNRLSGDDRAYDGTYYFSETLGCDVRLYFGEYTDLGEMQGDAYAVIERRNKLYTLAFDKSDYESIEDFERNVKKVTGE